MRSAFVVHYWEVVNVACFFSCWILLCIAYFGNIVHTKACPFLLRSLVAFSLAHYYPLVTFWIPTQLLKETHIVFDEDGGGGSMVCLEKESPALVLEEAMVSWILGVGGGERNGRG